MTENEIEEIRLPDGWSNPMDTFDAVCEECGTPARFEASDSRSIGDTFRHHCYSCNSGRFPGLGSTTKFRVTALDSEDKPQPVSFPSDQKPPQFTDDSV